METVFELLFEVLAEVVLQLLFELGFRPVASLFHDAGGRSWIAISYALVGALLGAASTYLVKQPLLHAEWMRWTNVLVTPLITGLLMALLGRARLRRGLNRIPLDSFAYGSLFALCFIIMRLLVMR